MGLAGRTSQSELKCQLGLRPSEQMLCGLGTVAARPCRARPRLQTISKAFSPKLVGPISPFSSPLSLSTSRPRGSAYAVSTDSVEEEATPSPSQLLERRPCVKVGL